jgi:hypothetical protein
MGLPSSTSRKPLAERIRGQHSRGLLLKNKLAGWYRNLDDRRGHGYWNGDDWVGPHDLAPPNNAPEDPPEGKVDSEGIDAP